MSYPAFIIARKEILDHARDRRSVMSAILYAAMGPLIAFLALAAQDRGARAVSSDLLSMILVFAVVSAFVGGMNVALDAVAGERERRSLVPLLMNPVQSSDIIAGKWLAVSAFGLVGLTTNIAGCAIIFGIVNRPSGISLPWYGVGLSIVSLICLVLLASAIQILVSTVCKSVKEAQPYVSMVLLGAMALAMLVVFRPQGFERSWFLFPIAGQQYLIGLGVRAVPPLASVMILDAVTVVLALAPLFVAAKLLRRDGVLFGNGQ